MRKRRSSRFLRTVVATAVSFLLAQSGLFARLRTDKEICSGRRQPALYVACHRPMVNTIQVVKGCDDSYIDNGIGGRNGHAAPLSKGRGNSATCRSKELWKLPPPSSLLFQRQWKDVVNVLHECVAPAVRLLLRNLCQHDDDQVSFKVDDAQCP